MASTLLIDFITKLEDLSTILLLSLPVWLVYIPYSSVLLPLGALLCLLLSQFLFSLPELMKTKSFSAIWLDQELMLSFDSYLEAFALKTILCKNKRDKFGAKVLVVPRSAFVLHGYI